jgi:hypothetical protein
MNFFKLATVEKRREMCAGILIFTVTAVRWKRRRQPQHKVNKAVS